MKQLISFFYYARPLATPPYCTKTPDGDLTPSGTQAPIRSSN